jgi:hypothetical protein
VLEHVSYGGLSGRVFTYRLFGDGRLDMRLETHHRDLLEGRELYLGRGEVDSLVALLVGAGVVECDRERLEARFLEAAGAVPIIADGGTIRLTLHLERYVSSTGAERSALRHTLSYQSPVSNRELLQRGSIPVFAELEALAELQQRLYGYWKLGRE